MSKDDNTTHAQETQEQSQQQQQETPEFYIDNDGKFVWSEAETEKADNVDDKEAEQSVSEEQKLGEDVATDEEAKASNYVEPKGKDGFYSKEEIETLGLDKLDPKKIPQELVPFYKSMQADYTRKTQALAEEKKKLKLLEEELTRKTVDLDIATKNSVPIEAVSAARNYGVEMARSILGDSFDEYNPETINLIGLYANAYIEDYKTRISITKRFQFAENYLRANDKYFDVVNNYALWMLQNKLTYAEARAIEQAKASGDVVPLLKLYDRARDELVSLGKISYGSEQPQAAASVATPQKQGQPQRQKAEPPVVEGVGGATQTMTPTKPKVKPAEFSGKTTAEQAAMLIEMGLV